LLNVKRVVHTVTTGHKVLNETWISISCACALGRCLSFSGRHPVAVTEWNIWVTRWSRISWESVQRKCCIYGWIGLLNDLGIEHDFPFVRMYRRVIVLHCAEYRLCSPNPEDVLGNGCTAPGIIHAVASRRLSSLTSCRLLPLGLWQHKLEYPVNTEFWAPSPK
jgi:hypothetical protein